MKVIQNRIKIKIETENKIRTENGNKNPPGPQNEQANYPAGCLSVPPPNQTRSCSTVVMF